MVSVNDAVEAKTLTKVAGYELPKNVAEWNEEILDQFIEQVNYLPKEFGIDISVKSVDENEGYAKGSIVVSYQEKQINFPIIVKEYELSPFDVFVYKDKGNTKFVSANFDSVKKVLVSTKIGEIENKNKNGQYPGIKRPGSILPKESVDVNDLMNSSEYPEFSKMSGWPLYADTEEMNKLAVQMKAETDVRSSFVDNTGDLVHNIIELNKNHKRTIGDDHKDGILDLKNVIKTKRVVTILDSQLFDVNSLKPVEAPSVCELRLYQYPTMEDYIESGDTMAGRFLATTNGKTVSGIVIDYKDSYDLKNDSIGCEPAICGGDDLADKKRIRNRREQVFISLDGKYYCRYNDYEKTGIGFYSSSIIGQDGAIEKAVQILRDKTNDNFTNINSDNKNDGSDKLFTPVPEREDGKKEYNNYASCGGPYGNLFVIYGAKNAYECTSFGGRFKKYHVNDVNVFVSSEDAIIPANVAGMQRVRHVKDPVYKMVLGKVKNIYLVPESALIINSGFMQSLNSGDIMRPSKPICQTYEEAAINKVAVFVNNGTYTIAGEPFKPLQKIAKIDGTGLNTQQTITSLNIMGVDTDTAKTAMKIALNRAADDDVADNTVTIWGVRGDYVNTDVMNGIEKQARVKNIIKQVCSKIRVNLIKEASALDDPEAVDVVLSLNFINEDSLNGYIENIRKMQNVSEDLAELLIASRMGLKDIDESSVKKAMDGLNKVIIDLEGVKLAVEG